jgi:hypothetical protein
MSKKVMSMGLVMVIRMVRRENKGLVRHLVKVKIKVVNKKLNKKHK